MQNLIDCLPLPDTGTDCTEALQAALDLAATCGGTVQLAPGEYLCGKLTVPAHITFSGTPAWCVDGEAGTVLRLCHEDALCLLDLSAAQGTSLCGLALCGRKLGKAACGILAFHDAPSCEKDAFHIENVKCSGFSGDGLRLYNINEAAIRHSLFCRNGENGVSMNGAHLLLTDTQCFENGASGARLTVVRDSSVSSSRFSGNRQDGLCAERCDALQLIGSGFDENTDAGLALLGDGDALARSITVSGCNFHDNGAIHLYAQYCYCLTVGGCLFAPGATKPVHAVCIDHLWHASLCACAMAGASQMEAIDDHCNHRGDIVVTSNIG